VHAQRVVFDPAAEEVQDPADLAVDTEQPQGNIDEHQLDLVEAEDGQVEDGIDEDGDTAVQVEKGKRHILCSVGHQEPLAAEHQHLEQEEGIYLVSGQLDALSINTVVDGDGRAPWFRRSGASVPTSP
jgi:hypothetical protein